MCFAWHSKNTRDRFNSLGTDRSKGRLGSSHMQMGTSFHSQCALQIKGGAILVENKNTVMPHELTENKGCWVDKVLIHC